MDIYINPNMDISCLNIGLYSAQLFLFLVSLGRYGPIWGAQQLGALVVFSISLGHLFHIPHISLGFSWYSVFISRSWYSVFISRSRYSVSISLGRSDLWYSISNISLELPYNAAYIFLGRSRYSISHTLV